MKIKQAKQTNPKAKANESIKILVKLFNLPNQFITKIIS